MKFDPLLRDIFRKWKPTPIAPLSQEAKQREIDRQIESARKIQLAHQRQQQQKLIVNTGSTLPKIPKFKPNIGDYLLSDRKPSLYEKNPLSSDTTSGPGKGSTGYIRRVEWSISRYADDTFKEFCVDRYISTSSSWQNVPDGYWGVISPSTVHTIFLDQATAEAAAEMLLMLDKHDETLHALSETRNTLLELLKKDDMQYAHNITNAYNELFETISDPVKKFGVILKMFGDLDDD